MDSMIMNLKMVKRRGSLHFEDGPALFFLRVVSGFRVVWVVSGLSGAVGVQGLRFRVVRVFRVSFALFFVGEVWCQIFAD